MPSYDYRCAGGHQFEVRHGINQSGPRRCPTCGKTVKRLISPPAVHAHWETGHAREHRGRGY